jgi:hypothetical protein
MYVKSNAKMLSSKVARVVVKIIWDPLMFVYFLITLTLSHGLPHTPKSFKPLRRHFKKDISNRTFRRDDPFDESFAIWQSASAIQLNHVERLEFFSCFSPPFRVIRLAEFSRPLGDSFIWANTEVAQILGLLFPSNKSRQLL